MIPQNFINDLLARIDIVEIIGTRIRLRKAGSNFIAPCPFHNEKTPSFTVSPSKQFYYCFGCKACGNVIGFLMRFENLGFLDTIEDLAAHLGVEIPRNKSQSGKTHDFTNLYKVLEKVGKFYQQQLSNSKKARAYLEMRGLADATCQHFGIGYALQGFHNLQSLINNKDKGKYLATGMIIQKNGSTYARFRDRLIFPIRDRRGRIIAFGGRTLGDDQAKYLNSPETPLFHKGNELYGLYEARKANSKLKSIIVVEGYMDVVTLAQCGITNVVATLGTSISVKQIQQLLRHTTEIVFCFDGDEAGRIAAWRALENTLPLMRDGIRVRFLFLPEKEDPDSLIRKEGAKSFVTRIVTGMLLSEFFFANLKQEINLESVDGRALLAQKAKVYLQRMANGVFKQLLLEQLAKLVKMDVQMLQQEKTVPFAEAADNSSFTENSRPVQVAINLLLYHPNLASNVSDPSKLSELPGLEVELLIKLINLLKVQQNFTIGTILEYYRDTQFMDLLAKLAVLQPIIPEEGLKNEFIGTIDMLCKQHVESKVQALLNKAATCGLSTEERSLLQDLIQKMKK